MLQDGKTAYERAFGRSDKEANRRMAVDTIFRIASQTKAITSAAIMARCGMGGTPSDRIHPVND